MRIAILSRNKNLHSIRRLLQEAKRLGVECDVVDPLECQVVVEGKSRGIMYHGRELPHYDAVLPRIGASVTDYGLAVVKQFESFDTYVVNGSTAISESRDKLRSLQVLSQSGVHVPATVLARGAKDLRAAMIAVKEMPVILKILRGTQGVGVMIVHSPNSLASVLETLNTLEEDVLIQEFLKKSAGKDYRVFVVGGKIVAAMLRTAPTGEFRSNIHRGGEGTQSDAGGGKPTHSSPRKDPPHEPLPASRRARDADRGGADALHLRPTDTRHPPGSSPGDHGTRCPGRG